MPVKEAKKKAVAKNMTIVMISTVSTDERVLARGALLGLILGAHIVAVGGSSRLFCCPVLYELLAATYTRCDPRFAIWHDLSDSLQRSLQRAASSSITHFADSRGSTTIPSQSPWNITGSWRTSCWQMRSNTTLPFLQDLPADWVVKER